MAHKPSHSNHRPRGRSLTQPSCREEARSTPKRWRLPPALRRRGQALLHQQCWCWGCDIRRGEGNLLLQHGFTRQRPPANVRGSSAYMLTLAHEHTVMLWGFGLCYVAAGAEALYLNRYQFTPLLVAQESLATTIFRVVDVPPLHYAQSISDCQSLARVLPAALNWIASYEHWVQATYGPLYRQQCLSGWPHASLAAEQMAETWQELATACETSLHTMLEHAS